MYKRQFFEELVISVTRLFASKVMGIGQAGFGSEAQRFAKEFWRKFDENEKRIEAAKKEPKRDTNFNGPIEIKNIFPENMEPDRIAVSIKETLLKAAQAPVDTTRRQQVFSPGS